MKRLIAILVKTSVVLLVVIALLFSALRLVFPYLNDFRQPIAHQIENISGVPVSIGHIEGEWLWFGPSLLLKDFQAKQDKFDIAINEVSLELDLWRSLLNLRWQFRDLTFHQVNLQIDNDVNDDLNDDFDIKPGSVGDIFLRRINYFDLKDSHISFFSPSGSRVSLYIPQLTWLNKRARHQAEGDVILSDFGEYQGKAKVILDLSDDSSGLLNQGMIYLQAKDVNMKPWLSRWVRDNTGLESANFNLSSWIRLENRHIEEGFLRLNDGDISWTTPDSTHHLDIDEQWLHLTKRSNGWQLDATQLNVNSDGNQWPKGSLSVYWQPEQSPDKKADKQIELVRIRATQLQLEYLKPLLPIFTFLDPETLTPWLELSPQGHLSTLALDVPFKQAKQTKFIAKWNDVSWLPWRNLPGVNHFDGYAEGNLDKGYLTVNLTDSTLPYETVFRAPLDVKQASGKVYWSNDNEIRRLWSDGVDIQARSLWINGDFGYSSSTEQGPWLSILAGINLDDARDAWRYYPEPLLGENLVNYLTAAIQSGHAKDASLIFEGDPKQFPFAKKEGRFEVFVPLRDATLQFQPTWQPLTHLMINLDFVDNGLWMRAENAKLVNVDAPQIVASIPAYDMQKLYLDADIKGTGNNVYEYLKDSPLKDSVAAALEQVQISGDVSGHLQLEIPLAPGKEVAASGSIDLDNNDILIKPVNLTLNKVRGSFGFTNETITSRPLNAHWFGQPVKLSFDTQKRPNDYRINVNLGGDWALSKLPIFSPQVAREFSGQANWQSHVAITLPNKGLSQYDITLQSNVSKVSEHLSSLLGNKKGGSVAVKLQAKGTPEQFNLSGNIGHNHINTAWRLGDNQIHIVRGAWQAHAASRPNLPGEDRFTFNVPEIDGDYWLPLLITQVSNQLESSQSNVAFSLPPQITLTSPAMTFAGQRWRELEIGLDKRSAGSTILIDSAELNATIGASNHGPWHVDINHLYYNPFWPEQVNSSNKPTERDLPITSFRSWPTLLIRCNGCWFMGQSFGKLEADLLPTGNTLKLAHGFIDTGNTRLLINGEWRSGPREANSAFKGILSGDRFDQSMRHFGVLTPLRDAPFTLDFDVSWRGEPWKPQINTLNGNLSTQFGQGELAHLGGGAAGQLLRLVSVTALLRQLQTDFSDSFGDDFDFDTIKATANIRNGVLTTNDLYISGTTADIGMSGRIDLAGQTINMEAVVAPELSVTVGVATAFVINPVAGVAVFAASKVLAPLWNKISFIRYQITGTFDNPKVSEILRQTNKEK